MDRPRDGSDTCPAETASALVREATRRLDDAGLPSAAAEARTLVSHVLGIDLGRLPLAGPVSPTQQEQTAELVRQRLDGQPLSHLLGMAWFRNVSLRVGPGVFTPRPETEVMTGWALDWLSIRIATGTANPVVVELGTGSGAIAAAISDERPAARVHAVELSEQALGYAAQNLSRSSVDLRHGDLATAFDDLDGTVDLVISNPPYIPLERWEEVAPEVRLHEPELALFSGADGLDAMHAVAATAYRLLRSAGAGRAGGVVCAEHAELQHYSAPAVFTQHGGFVDVADHHDLTGRPRFVTAERADSGRMER